MIRFFALCLFAAALTITVYGWVMATIFHLPAAAGWQANIWPLASGTVIALVVFLGLWHSTWASFQRRLGQDLYATRVRMIFAGSLTIGLTGMMLGTLMVLFLRAQQLWACLGLSLVMVVVAWPARQRLGRLIGELARADYQRNRLGYTTAFMLNLVISAVGCTWMAVHYLNWASQ